MSLGVKSVIVTRGASKSFGIVEQETVSTSTDAAIHLHVTRFMLVPP
jgi:hypothetical protein